jgi:uncharacterized protein (TIGR04255 family)
MNKLIPPPLIESIFELRWGESSPNNFHFDNSDKSMFLMKFGTEAGMKGFREIESINPEVPEQLPMIIKHRFWKTKDVWPCMQIGLGIFTVNQTSANYQWKNFISAIESGLDIFNSIDDGRLNRIQSSGKLRLIYQDLFPLEKSLDVVEFLKNKLNIELGIPEKLLLNSNFGAIDSLALSFSIKVKDPIGKMIINVSSVVALPAGPSFLVETAIESNLRDIDSNSIDGIKSWADSAHVLQKHSYKHLMLKE